MPSTRTPIGGPAAWKGPEIDWKEEGLHLLDAAEIAEIDGGVRHLKSLGDVDLNEITTESFPLDRMGETLRGLQDRLRRGRGFVMLRGLPRERYSEDDMARIFFGLGAYVGTPMYQSYQGELLGHVMDVSDFEEKPRAYHAGGHMGMHSDSCDIVALMCLRASKEGGASRIASAVAVHDELVRTRPELAEALYRGFHYRRMDLDAQHGSGIVVSKQRIPVFTRRGDELACYFLGGYAKRAAANGDVELSALELEAIDEAERLAASDRFYLDMNFADGDIQFLNNRLMLHGRTGFQDPPDVGRRRHLLRLWLRVPSWPPLPTEQIFHTAEDHRLWARQRTKLMELPSTYLDRLRASQKVPA